MRSFFHHSLSFGVLFALALPLLHAQDAPVDIAQLLQALKAMKEQQAQQLKAQKQRALQEVQAAASSPASAAASWEEAVRQVQFEGAPREGTQFRDWKEKEGAGLDHKEGQNAARLYFVWLGLTLQHSAGLQVKDLLAQIVSYTKEATALIASVDDLADHMKKEKDPGPGGKRPGRNERKNDDDEVKRMCDQIMKAPLPGSVPVKAMKLDDLLGPENFGGADGPPGGRPGSRGNANAKEWEMSPGNVDGIFEKIILPELRAQRDPRLLEYWDVKIKREGDAAAKTKLAFDAERFTQFRRPDLLWSRAEDELVLGQRNKAINDMFGLIKGHPAHPNASSWVSRLEVLLTPPPSAPPSASPRPPAAAPTTGAPVSAPGAAPAPAPGGPPAAR